MRMILIVDNIHPKYAVTMIVAKIHPKYAVENCVGSQREILRVTSGSPGEVAPTRRTALKVESEK